MEAVWDDPDGEALRQAQRDEIAALHGGNRNSEPGAAPSSADISVFLIARDGDGAALACGALRQIDGTSAEVKRMYRRAFRRQLDDRSHLEVAGSSTPVAIETASNHPAPPWSPAEPGWPAATLPSDHPSGQAASACRWPPKSPASETIAASRNRLTIPYSLRLTPPKRPVRPPDCLAKLSVRTEYDTGSRLSTPCDEIDPPGRTGRASAMTTGAQAMSARCRPPDTATVSAARRHTAMQLPMRLRTPAWPSSRPHR